MPQVETRTERRARQRLARRSPGAGRQSRWWLWLVPVLMIGGGLWWLVDRPTSTTTDSRRADQQLLARCTTDAATIFHIHPHLSIIINGQEQPVPTDVGINGSCLHVIHTHDASGILHIESPVRKDFSLGNFFTIWQRPFSTTTVLDHALAPDEQLKVFADGHEVATGPATVMRNLVSYAIIVGRTATTITPPPDYRFPTTL